MKSLIEKLKKFGEESLTIEENLSLIISRNCTKEENIKIAKDMIEKNKDLTGDLRFLGQVSIYELVEQGLEWKEAARLKAVYGIIKKLSNPINENILEMNSSVDVVNFFMPELRFEKSEIVKLVIMDNKNVVLKIVTISKGTTDSATISPKDILSEPIRLRASKIILVHNHPSRRFHTK